MKNVFDQNDVKEIISRINNLEPTTQGLWGKMSVSQMLAHCNVAYENAYEKKYSKPRFLKGLLLKWVIKPIVVGDKPYAKNSRTSPEFLMTDEKEFLKEKSRLIDYINKTFQHGEAYFEGKDSGSFGKLTAKEWSNMFGKHLDHHLGQFAV